MKTGKHVSGKTQRKFAGTFSHGSQQSNALSGKASGNENVEAPSQEKNGNELNASDVGHSSSNTTKVISNSDTVLDTNKEMQQVAVEETIVTSGEASPTI